MFLFIHLFIGRLRGGNEPREPECLAGASCGHCCCCTEILRVCGLDSVRILSSRDEVPQRKTQFVFLGNLPQRILFSCDIWPKAKPKGYYFYGNVGPEDLSVKDVSLNKNGRA